MGIQTKGSEDIWARWWKTLEAAGSPSCWAFPRSFHSQSKHWLGVPPVSRDLKCEHKKKDKLYIDLIFLSDFTVVEFPVDFSKINHNTWSLRNFYNIRFSKLGKCWGLSVWTARRLEGKARPPFCHVRGAGWSGRHRTTVLFSWTSGWNIITTPQFMFVQDTGV